jgi:hypothetical protein
MGAGASSKLDLDRSNELKSEAPMRYHNPNSGLSFDGNHFTERGVERLAYDLRGDVNDNCNGHSGELFGINNDEGYIQSSGGNQSPEPLVQFHTQRRQLACIFSSTHSRTSIGSDDLQRGSQTDRAELRNAEVENERIKVLALLEKELQLLREREMASIPPVGHEDNVYPTMRSAKLGNAMGESEHRLRDKEQLRNESTTESVPSIGDDSEQCEVFRLNARYMEYLDLLRELQRMDGHEALRGNEEIDTGNSKKIRRFLFY